MDALRGLEVGQLLAGVGEQFLLGDLAAGTTTAVTASIQRSSGRPITATSATPGWV